MTEITKNNYRQIFIKAANADDLVSQKDFEKIEDESLKNRLLAANINPEKETSYQEWLTYLNNYAGIRTNITLENQKYLKIHKLVEMLNDDIYTAEEAIKQLVSSTDSTIVDFLNIKILDKDFIPNNYQGNDYINRILTVMIAKKDISSVSPILQIIKNNENNEVIRNAYTALAEISTKYKDNLSNENKSLIEEVIKISLNKVPGYIKEAKIAIKSIISMIGNWGNENSIEILLTSFNHPYKKTQSMADLNLLLEDALKKITTRNSLATDNLITYLSLKKFGFLYNNKEDIASLSSIIESINTTNTTELGKINLRLLNKVLEFNKTDVQETIKKLLTNSLKLKCFPAKQLLFGLLVDPSFAKEAATAIIAYQDNSWLSEIEKIETQVKTNNNSSVVLNEITRIKKELKTIPVKQ